MREIILIFAGAAFFGYLAGGLISVFRVHRLKREIASQREQIKLIAKNQSCLPQRLIEIGRRGDRR